MTTAAARRPPSRRAPVLGACIALAIGLHATAAWLALESARGLPARATPATEAAAGASRITLVAAAQQELPAIHAPLPPAERAAPAAQARVARPVVTAMASSEATAAPGHRDGRGVERYVPRPELSVVPVAGRPPLLAYPDDGPASGLFVARLALYIDETGVVRRVEPEGARLPPVLEEAARQAFLAVPYHPGQIDGVNVKSLIRIEVTFESRDAPAPAPSASAPVRE